MSHDLDDALRSAMRRRAEDAPTYVDLDGVRGRAREIRRRRTVEVLAAGVVAVGVVLGLGAVVGTLRHDATPPPVTTQSPTPGALPLLAFTRGDANAQPTSATQILLRVDGADRVLTTTSAATELLGWYGPDHRTLVWGVQAKGGFREVTLYAVTVGDDGHATGAPAPLTVPGTATLGAGIPFVVPGGPIQLWVPTNPGDPKSPAVLVTVAADLSRALTRPMPVSTRPAAVTLDHIALIDVDSHLSVADLTVSGISAPKPVEGCSQTVGALVNLDGSTVAIACIGGTVIEVRLADRHVTRLPAIPETNADVWPISLWWDPSGGIHAATTPTMRNDYTVVHSWDWNGTIWAPGQDGVLRRTYPQGSPSARYVKENASPGNNGRWIVESSPEVDLGPSGGDLVVVPVAGATTPTPSPSVAAPPWTATVRDYAAAAGSPPGTAVWARVEGREVKVDDDGNAASSVLGWYGPDHRTLVWQTGQGLMTLRAATFGADGTMTEAAHDLTVPGVSDPFSGLSMAVPGHGFVLWHQLSGSGTPRYEMVRVDDALTKVSAAPTTDGALVFATSSAYAVSFSATTPITAILMTTGTGSTRVALTSPCADLVSGVPSPDGRSVALGCGSGTDTEGAHVAVLDIANATATDTVLPAGRAHLWWDTSSTLHASTVRGTGAATFWVLASGRWSLDEGQTAVLRVFPTTGPSLRWTPSGTGDDGTWVAESDPEVDLGAGQGTPVFGLGAANIVAR